MRNSEGGCGAISSTSFHRTLTESAGAAWGLCDVEMRYRSAATRPALETSAYFKRVSELTTAEQFL